MPAKSGGRDTGIIPSVAAARRKLIQLLVTQDRPHEAADPDPHYASRGAPAPPQPSRH